MPCLTRIEMQIGELELSEKRAFLGTNAKRRGRIVRKTDGFGDECKAPSLNCPKNRRFWGRTQSGEVELSEKQAVLGMNAKRRGRIVRKTGSFGDERKAISLNCPKNRRFWGRMQSDELELSEKQAVLGTNAKRRGRIVRKKGGFGDEREESRVRGFVIKNQIRFSATLIIESTSIKEQAQNLSYGW